MVVSPYYACSQAAKLPAFYPISEHAYDIKSGLPDMYMTEVLVDQHGRISILKNGTGRTAFASVLYEYDGVKSYSSSFNLRHNHTDLFAKPIPSEMYYGYYQYPVANGLGSDFFTYDPIAKISKCIPVSESTDDRIIQSATAAEGSFFVLAYQKKASQFEILQIQNDHITSVSTFQPDQILPSPVGNIGVTDQYFWISTNSNYVFRIGRIEPSIRSYPLSRDRYLFRVPTIVSSQKELWLSNGGENFKWDPSKERFTKNPFKPDAWNHEEIKMASVFKDQKENILVRYHHERDVQSATLIDHAGQFFDFTPVMSNHNSITGSDFKQSLIFYDPGLRFVDVSDRRGVQKIQTLKGSRGIAELGDRTLYLSTADGNLLIHQEGNTWRTEPNSIPCLDKAFIDSDLARNENGCFWFTSRSQGSKRILFRYDPEHTTCDSFDLGLVIERFDFMGKGQMVFASKDGVYLWEDQASLPTQIFKFPSPAGINQVLTGTNGFIWVATDQGLLKIDPTSKDHQWLDLMGETNTIVIRMHQDATGKLWLGTALKGIMVIDPLTGNIQVIDLSVGLSNNTVVSFLEDDDGAIWAGTFCGITLLSPEGEVLGRLYEEDGLVDNECNRWSSLKMNDGRLCFGSVEGMTVIDPARWKEPYFGYTSPQIYLTGLSRQHTGKKPVLQEDLLSVYRKNERLVLPAHNRSLKAVFVLSNYASPEKATFAYQFEGIDDSWNYIGSQRQLSLASLPFGRYNILIKGSDGRGKWSDPPIVIPVRVQKFFYQQWWFFVLCSIPFLVFLLLWLHRQRGETKRLETEVQNRTATIQEQADKLQEMDRAKSLLYTNITHELRTPLTVISGMAELIDENPDAARELITRNSKGLLNLVNQILDLAKLESGHLKLELIQADIVRFVSGLAQSLQSYAHQKNLHLIFQTEVDQLLMDFDERKMEIIVSNLLSNAIKFSNDQGHIHLKLQQVNDRLLIRVTDEGIGISSDELPQIFDRFYQAEDAKDSRNTRIRTGSGIGLTLTKELVDMMEGEITVESQEGKGTTFSVSLPVRNQAPVMVLDYENARQAAAPIEEDVHPESTTDGSLPLLLLIEDNVDVAAYVRACLQGRYAVEWTMNGAIGIERALATIPDIIISDVMMPEKDGFEVCQALKNDERTSHIPIILLTAKSDVASRLEGLGAGADAYLSKPFLKEELFIRLDKLVELRRNLQERYANMGGSAATDTITEPDRQPGLDEQFLQKIRSNVEAHLSDPEFGNEELSRKMHLSQSQLFRKLKALTGQSIAIHIRSIRLQKARDLIQNSDLSIAEIAYSTGFNDPSYFTRTFSMEFGMLPTDLRK